ncbi:chlorophyll A-B binding protein [Fragilaria crotonensis]|nr:chlorophyll A-B binding protein [Fragilaria crotonensis]
MKIAATLSLLATASAFAPASKPVRSSVAVQETKADLEVLAKKLNPVLGFYDPLNLAEAEFWGASNEATIGFLRHSEIKHGRIAMFAFVGYIVHANGIKFPWAMQMDGTPFPSETNPPALWDAIPEGAKWQIFSAIAFLEFWSELSTPNHKHYMAGGRPGDYPDFVSGKDGIPHPVPFNLFDPFKLSKNKSAEAKERGLVAELNNGRLAQIGILGFLCEQKLAGSVPLLSGIVQSYDGEPMAPFTENVLGMPFGL